MSYPFVNESRQDSFNYIASATAVAIKTGAGRLDRVVLNSAGTAWEIDVYDGTSTTGASIAQIRNASVPIVLLYDIPFTNGLYLDTVKGTTAGNLLIKYF